MGQNAFVERHSAPNSRLHVAIFLAIVVLSIFLASQVEKSKDNADIAALKNPVPIDSIAIDADPSAKSTNKQKEIVPTIKAPVVNSTPEENMVATVTESDQEYVFESEDTLVSIRNRLETQQEAPLASDISVASPDMESVEVIIETESKISQQTSQDIDNQKSSADPMDLAYQQQQDRFLQTLAKSAQLDTKESIEIKKLKAAIREDKPLSREAKTVKAPVVKKVVAAPVQDATQNIQKPSIKKAKTYQPQAQIVAVKMQLPGSNNTRTSETISNRIESTAKSSLPQLTKGELNKIVSQFAHSYNKGDINRLMALFADNATTNDQTSKLGIKADYAELFNSTEHRNLMIKEIKWRLGEDKAEGAADFVVTVQPKNSVERNLYRGYIKITAIKQYKDVYITRLIHELK